MPPGIHHPRSVVCADDRASTVDAVLDVHAIAVDRANRSILADAGRSSTLQRNVPAPRRRMRDRPVSSGLVAAGRSASVGVRGTASVASRCPTLVSGRRRMSSRRTAFVGTGRCRMSGRRTASVGAGRCRVPSRRAASVGAGRRRVPSRRTTSVGAGRRRVPSRRTASVGAGRCRVPGGRRVPTRRWVTRSA